MHLQSLFWTMAAMKASTAQQIDSAQDECDAGGLVRLFATHYSGTVATLDLTIDDDGKGNLTRSAATEDVCGAAPSWLTWEESSKALFCSDESAPGTLYSLTIGMDGSLSVSAKIVTLGGDVSNGLFSGADGQNFIGIAHYNGNVSTFSLPLKSDAEPLQEFAYKMANPGPVADRQATSHPHQVIVDPSGKFLLTPDLGMDVVHVFSIDSTTGKLSQQEDLKAPLGSGPRHITFNKDGSKMYLVHEISNEVSSWTVDPQETGLTFTQIDIKPTFKDKAPTTFAASEIRFVDNNLYVANRNMSTPPSDDTITTFLVDPATGIPQFVEQTSTHGSYPRTFAISQDKSLVAIGNQKSSTVVILERDLETGKLSEQPLASVVVAEGEGLSSVVFAE